MELEETPVIFDLLCALYVLSTINSSVKVRVGSRLVSLNLYILFVADSGITRKSTAVNWSRKVIEGCTDIVSPIIISKQQSPESIAKLRATNLCFIASELVNLFGTSSYAAGLPATLTELYDGGDKYCTLLGASAPSWFNKSINPDVIQGGFTSRCLVGHATKGKGLRPWPEVTEDEQTFISRCTSRIMRMSELYTQAGNREERDVITFDEQARKCYERWYCRRPIEEGSYSSSFSAREPDHITKVAGLFAINNYSASISVTDFDLARRLVQYCKGAGRCVFEKSTTDNLGYKQDKLRSTIQHISNYLAKQGLQWTAQEAITRRFYRHATAGGLRNILDVMHDLKMVQRTESIPSSQRGRRATLWRGTTLLVSQDMLNQVVPLVDRSRI